MRKRMHQSGPGSSTMNPMHVTQAEVEELIAETVREVEEEEGRTPDDWDIRFSLAAKVIFLKKMLEVVAADRRTVLAVVEKYLSDEIADLDAELDKLQTSRSAETI